MSHKISNACYTDYLFLLTRYRRFEFRKIRAANWGGICRRIYLHLRAPFFRRSYLKRLETLQLSILTTLYTVTIKFPNRGQKSTQKDSRNSITIIQYCLRPLGIMFTTNRMHEKKPLLVSPSFISSQSAGSMKQPQISSFL
jgi:hypothetical protein